MKARQAAVCGRAGLFVCLALCLPARASAAEADDIAEMKRAIEALRAENRELTQRIRTLEGERPFPRLQAIQAAPAPPGSGGQAGLERRVADLELAKNVQEDAVRNIVRDSVSTLGSKINQYVTLGGAIEVTTGRHNDFSRRWQTMQSLSTAEFDFEIQVNDWTLANMIVEYVDGTNVIFPTTDGYQASVDRVNLDTAFVTIGDVQRFPPFLKAGRMTLPFGISTGSSWADVLSTENPLTIEAFEARKTAIGLGFAWPTPALKPPTPPVVAPPVKPLVVAPLVGALSRRLGYNPPPTRPRPLSPAAFTPAPPLFNAGVYFYDGNGLKAPTGNSRPAYHISATAGLHTRGHCGRPYDELKGFGICPWTLDLDLGYNTSVFDSRFLEAEYRAFLNQIRFVSGMSASIKSNLGRISFVGEWNGAIERARFVDDLGKRVAIKPSAWQVSLGYQFDWNPWVESIGSQGTYLAVGYSESRDLAGVTQLINGEPNRVGFVPRRRLILTAGEWVLDGVRMVLEYSRNWDYPARLGGTGRMAEGVFLSMTYVW